jgi:biotin carboxylase
MKKFEGKKLLLLGSNVGTLDLIRYAKEHGAFTIVADNLPKDKSFGKQVADKDVMISTGDLEALKEYIKAEHVDGVFAGISEFNLLSAMKLCEHFNFPFYCTKSQWDCIEDKEIFRNMCGKYHVPCPKTYFSGSIIPDEVLATICYPAIIKPVDASSSIGVTICRTQDALLAAVPDAKRNSEKGRFIIEEFFEGEEFTAHYTIANGEVTLSCVDNRVPVAIHEGEVITIPLARVYPSTFTTEYIRQVNKHVIKLCKSLKMSTGVLFVQGLYNKQQNLFCIFEAGLRCAGEAPYRLIEKVNGISFMNNFVDYALLGRVEDFDSSKDDPYMNNKVCCVASFVAKGGTVGEILNFEETVKKVPSIVDSECRYHEGDIVPDGNTLRQIMLRFVLICDKREQLVKDIEYINNSVKVLDEDGQNMCYTFDARSYFCGHTNKRQIIKM